MSARQSHEVRCALELVRGGLTPYSAAKKMGIALSTIYRALKRSRQLLPPTQEKYHED